MSISWAYFRPQGPPRRQALQNQLPESLRAFDEAGGEHHERWAYFRPQGPNQPPDSLRAFDEAGGEHHEHRALLGAGRSKTNCSSHCAHLTRQEGSIMSFRPQGPPRRQALQNQLPESLRAFDEAGGEHHEHQLGVFPATGPS